MFSTITSSQIELITVQMKILTFSWYVDIKCNMCSIMFPNKCSYLKQYIPVLQIIIKYATEIIIVIELY